MPDPKDFWLNRRVFLTGHTGFKGGWLALWLARRGAIVRGFALAPNSAPNFFTDAGVSSACEDVRGDIRDGAALDAALIPFEPEVVFHLAAQPLVRTGYALPVETFETNVVGTARLLDSARRCASVRAVLSVTTDKVYENPETSEPFREGDPLGGHDPYSASKAGAEIVTASFRRSYFAAQSCSVATARAGNVIGGGDWSADRLLPDLIRGFLDGRPALIRRPAAVRPWQHVLEPLAGYILLAEHLLSATGEQFAKAYNFGPKRDDAKPVRWIADRLVELWGDDAAYILDPDPGVHEAASLRLDAMLAETELGWRPRLDLDTALHWVVDWHRAVARGEDMHCFSLAQIEKYEALG